MRCRFSRNVLCQGSCTWPWFSAPRRTPPSRASTGHARWPCPASSTSSITPTSPAPTSPDFRCRRRTKKRSCQRRWVLGGACACSAGLTCVAATYMYPVHVHARSKSFYCFWIFYKPATLTFCRAPGRHRPPSRLSGTSSCA